MDGKAWRPLRTDDLERLEAMTVQLEHVKSLLEPAGRPVRRVAISTLAAAELPSDLIRADAAPDPGMGRPERGDAVTSERSGAEPCGENRYAFIC
jgi:hypothetical protein